jgi:hypothetical protein
MAYATQELDEGQLREAIALWLKRKKNYLQVGKWNVTIHCSFGTESREASQSVSVNAVVSAGLTRPVTLEEVVEAVTDYMISELHHMSVKPKSVKLTGHPGSSDPGDASYVSAEAEVEVN